MGKSTLGLALGLNIAETLLAPAMPSTSARAGGIFMPIIKSLSEASGSFPGEAVKTLRRGPHAVPCRKPLCNVRPMNNSGSLGWIQ